MRRTVPICYRCPRNMVQTDMFDAAKERVVGCTLMRQRDWARGLKADAPGEPEYQHSCPLVKKGLRED